MQAVIAVKLSILGIVIDFPYRSQAHVVIRRVSERKSEQTVNDVEVSAHGKQ